MQHPDVMRFLAQEHVRELEADALRARRRRQRPAAASPAAVDEAQVALRLCRVDDDAALERLAELEGRPAPHGRFVLAEVDGVVVAAVPLAGGAALTDPFRATAHLVPLLRLRADQVVRPEKRRRFSLRHSSLIRGSIHA
jgi:hypothetical protein